MVVAAQERPPYVQFEVKDVEDRLATIATGRWTSKDIVFAIITPQGSKDRIERVAEEWFAEKREQVRAQRFPREWFTQYEAAYKAFLSDEEPPVNGRALRNWPAISPSQYRLLRDLRILTVEDLAAANEETLTRIGMGGRALKQKAAEWLAEAAGIGTKVEEVESLRADNESLSAAVASLTDQVNNLIGQVRANQGPSMTMGQGEPGDSDFTIS